MRLGTVFVAICMVIIAASAGAIAYLYLEMDRSGAIAVGFATLALLALYNNYATRGMRSTVGHQLTDLSRGGADLARQVAEMGRRLAAMEGKVESALDRTRAATDPLAAEIGELGTLVKQLAETVAAHQTTLGELARPPALSPMPRVAEAPTSVPPVDAPQTPSVSAAPSEPEAGPETKVAAIASGGFKGLTNEEALAIVRSATEANRVDLYLQPIVTLPQRKVRFYEAMSRLRSEGGDVFQAADFIALAESGGLMPKIDNLVVFRCVQIVRRLLLKNRDIGVFCNLSAATLTDAVFPQFLEFMDANRAIAPSLVLEFAQSSLRNMGPMENESLAALAERGYRFSLDNVTDLRLEPRELANRSFRFIKIPASLLLNRSPAAPADIHPSDLSDLLGRFGIDLIADKIESEGSVVDLLDCDVRFGQGFLFSPPRPVRAEALQGINERTDVIARESAPAPADGSAANARVAETEPPPDTGTETRTVGLAQLARNFANRN